MFLAHTRKSQDIVFTKHTDILHLASLLEYNISYAIAFLITLDPALVKSIIATFNVIEDRCKVLSDNYKDDLLSVDDSYYALHCMMFDQFTTINEHTIDIIKASARIYEAAPEATESLQDINGDISLLFKSCIDAYIQHDAQIAINAQQFYIRSLHLCEGIADPMGERVAGQLRKIIHEIHHFQDAIITHYTEEDKQ